MNTLRKLAVWLLAASLAGCAAGPGGKVVKSADHDIETLRQIWPGSYSNFAQVHAQAADNPVADIRIRQLVTNDTPVFLFEWQLRDQDTSEFDLYWLKPDRETHQPELFFTRLSDDELSRPMQETLTSAWQRVLTGCVIVLERDGDRYSGQTNPDTCVFGDPINGKTRLARRITIGADTMTIETGIMAAGNRETGGGTMLELQKNHGFSGRASINLASAGQPDEATVWQKSQLFSIRDDGRLKRLYDEQKEPMGFGLQLAKLRRFDAEPHYFLLSVINLANGQIQAYQWFAPGSKRLELNFDWFQTRLEARSEEDPES